MISEMRILGIDPGSHATGWGVVSVSPVVRRVASGVIRPGRAVDLPERLLHIHAALEAVIDAHAPTTMVVEALFNARNARSSLVLGHARGAALLAGARAGIEICEYTPAEIKKALTGNGQASKEQVRFMVMRLLSVREAPGLDESDALAVALAHQGRTRVPGGRRARA